jgi:hypothetical protein
MILVRDIFQLKFGKSKDALQHLKEGFQLARKNGYEPDRLLTDFTGPYYTVVMEGTHKDLAAYEKSLHSELGSEEWKKWYAGFVPLVESGSREIFTVVENNSKGNS